MITKVDVVTEMGTVATFTWKASKEYYGWETLRAFCKTLEGTLHSFNFSYEEE